MNRLYMAPRYKSFMDMPWAILLLSQKDNTKMWREFTETETGKAYVEGKNIDSDYAGLALGSYLWG